MFWPDDLNASDDELFFLVYLSYAWAHSAGNYSLNRTSIDEAMQLSLLRTWRGVQSESLSLWNFAYAFFQLHFNNSASGAAINLPEAFPYRHPTDTLSDAIAASVWQLGTFPLDLLNWPVNNTLRVDVSSNPLVPNCIDHAVDYDELPIPAEWNGNPLVVTGGTGEQLGTPTLYLLPYWLGRFAGFIQAPASV